MGDIIWGAFITFLIVVVFGLYRFFTRKTERRSVTQFLSLLIILGGLLGVLTTSINSLHEGYSPLLLMVLFFFIMQTYAGTICYKGSKPGWPLLALTLLFQVPSFNTDNLSYSNQSLFSLDIKNYPGKFWDIEPGSYVHFISTGTHSATGDLSLGVNLIPLLIIFIYWRKGMQLRRSEN